jgi:tetratricopeptide (TPR) repeat protein
MRLRLNAAILLAVASFSVDASADALKATAVSTTATGEARERFQRGVVLYREGSFDAALAEFRRAYEIAPNYRILFNLAQVQVERHDWVAALRAYAEYLQQGGAEIDVERNAQVERDMQSLRARVADLIVKSDVVGAQLLIDNFEIATLPLTAAILVNSGVHQVTVVKPGFSSASRTITIAGDQPMEITMSLQALEVRPSFDPLAERTNEAPNQARAAAGHPLPTGFWLSAVSTGVFAAAAVTFGILTHEQDSKLDDRLNQFPSNEQAIADTRKRLKTDAALTDAFTAASLVAAVAGVYFLATNTSPGEAALRKAGDPKAVSLAVCGSSLCLWGKF